MTNREYFKDPDDQCRMFLLERCWGKVTGLALDRGIEKLKWLKSKVSPLAKSIPRCPVCGKLPERNYTRFLVCPDPRCKFNEIQRKELIDIWQRRCTNGN